MPAQRATAPLTDRPPKRRASDRGRTEAIPARRAKALWDPLPKKQARDRGQAGVMPARRATAQSEFSPRPGRFTRAMRCNAGKKAGLRCRSRSQSKVGSKIRPSCLPGRARFSTGRPSRRSCNGGSGRKWSMASRCRLARFRKSGLRCLRACEFFDFQRYGPYRVLWTVTTPSKR